MRVRGKNFSTLLHFQRKGLVLWLIIAQRLPSLCAEIWRAVELQSEKPHLYVFTRKVYVVILYVTVYKVE